jgi:hypothetical protein
LPKIRFWRTALRLNPAGDLLLMQLGLAKPPQGIKISGKFLF